MFLLECISKVRKRAHSGIMSTSATGYGQRADLLTFTLTWLCRQKTFLPIPFYKYKDNMKGFLILSRLTICCLGISAQTMLSNNVDPHTGGIINIGKTYL